MSDAASGFDADQGDTGRFDDAYRRLVGYVGGGDDPADPADVLAMQMVVRIEKAHPPARADLLSAAARAAVLLCLDDRAGGDGPWAAPMAAWCDARIRKIARRARGAQWAAAQEVWGLTVEDSGAEARAIVPGRVGDVDRRISRLQIGGTDLEGALPIDPPGRGVCLWINPQLEMSVGKAAAQVGHGSMLAVMLMDLPAARDWRAAGCPLVVREATRDRWDALLEAEGRGAAVAVRDAGFTEVAPGSVTVVAEVIG
ncbi:aminoacyl-tRNA hydrolase [Gordonia sp. OPL2]|uniref:aminoacyl-tRNA hydrolase n=1 Tax=Gordonia sp. OPL2 TaxID=2486274 RepID=UPI0021CC5D67|nr:aminoacyl-tRNA hydrolase [Gordonia sp. OPL2]